MIEVEFHTSRGWRGSSGWVLRTSRLLASWPWRIIVRRPAAFDASATYSTRRPTM